MDFHSIANQLRRARFNYRVMAAVRDSFWAEELRRFNVDPSGMSYDGTERSLNIEDLGLRLFKPEHSFVVKGITFARALQKKAGALFQNVGDLIIVQLDELSFEVRTFEELFILHEIFVEGVYNIKLPERTIVVDIGANVGFSSVLLARDPNVSKVISFEPIEITYQHAVRNVSLNPRYSPKIELHNFGLSDKTETIEIDFSDEIKGSVGIRGLGHRYDIDRTKIRKEKLKVLDAGSEIGKIISQSAGTPVVLKIDCEGSEYRIIDSLIEKGQLERPTSIMMEWHDPLQLSDLETKLTTAGFTVFSLSPNSPDVGMIYASRSGHNSR